MNKTKWTNKKFKQNEKIDCTIFINVSSYGSDQFVATVQVGSSRPIFNSTYISPVLNFNDKDFSFKYVEYENLVFNPNSFDSNLVSVMAYYAYIIIAYDYESFSKEGGTPYFQKAQTTANNVPSNIKSAYKGWSQFDGGVSFTTGTINRYVLTDNWLNPRYSNFRTVFFNYHFNGLDRMYTDASQGRAVITSGLTSLQSINTDNPGLLPLGNFFISKSADLIYLYSKSDMSERSIAIQTLSTLDPVNGEKYKQIGKK